MYPKALSFIGKWTRSSVGLERHTTDVEVTGSNPVESAIKQKKGQLRLALFALQGLGSGFEAIEQPANDATSKSIGRGASKHDVLMRERGEATQLAS